RRDRHPGPMTALPGLPYAACMWGDDASWGHRAGPRWGWLDPRIDILPALIIGVIQVVGTTFAGHHQTGRTSLDALGYLPLSLGPLALVFRRRWPVQVLGFAIAVTLTYTLLRYPNGPIWLVLILALFTVMIRGYRLAAWTGVVIGYLAFGWLGALIGTERAPS